jgi:Tfp pilus assembly protein PilX
MPSPRSKPARGSALLLAMLLLTVLTVIGVAAVALSSQERQNASAKTRLDFLTACANAAQAKIWAEMAQYGLGYLGSTVNVTAQSLADGTQVAAPAHYDDFDASATAKLVKDVVFKVESSGTTQTSMNERDCTNGACGMTPLGQSYGMTALCIDPSGREFEVELAVKFAL